VLDTQPLRVSVLLKKINTIWGKIRLAVTK
jgi:hypothetical protein